MMVTRNGIVWLVNEDLLVNKDWIDYLYIMLIMTNDTAMKLRK